MAERTGRRIAFFASVEGKTMDIKAKRQYISTFSAALLVVAGAVFCRAVVLVTTSPPLGTLANYVRILLYIGLLSAWDFSVERRVMQSQVRRYLVAVSLLMVLWLTVREFRWHLVMQADIRRWLWYLYYVPILLIPLLALFVSMSLGKLESYQLPRWTRLLYLPTAALVLLVLSNDMHRQVFRFSAAPSDSLDYRYGPVFLAVFGWVSLCSLSAFNI